MRAVRLVLSALIAGATRRSSSAQTPAAPPVSHSVSILPATRIAALADSLPAGAMNSVAIGRWEGLNDMLGRRDSDGVHESHENFADIFVVQRGVATLRYGGIAVGDERTTPGEWRGGDDSRRHRSRAASRRHRRDPCRHPASTAAGRGPALRLSDVQSGRSMSR